MRLIVDATALVLYPFAKPGLSAGTEGYIKRLISGLAANGHQVHVVAPDLDSDEERGPNEHWWPNAYHPIHADAVVMVQDLRNVVGYVAEHFLLATTQIDPWLGDDQSWGARLSRVACLTESHVDLLTRTRPSVLRDKCVVTGLGVDAGEYAQPYGVRLEHLSPNDEAALAGSVRGRMLYANDPTRGLYHTLQIFDRVREAVPEATLHVAYDFDKQFEPFKWQATDMTEQMWLCKERIERGDGVVNLGALSHDQLVREQLECHVHVMPSDPPNVGSQLHGLTQMECAAAGVPLVVSNIEAFPELFSECGSVLPLPGCMAAVDGEGDLGRVTYDDWASEVVGLMTDSQKWQTASEKSRATAAKYPWAGMVDRWETMLAGLQ